MGMKIFGTAVFGMAILIGLAVMTAFILLCVFAVKALVKYGKSGEVQKEVGKEVGSENETARKSLGEVLRRHREACKMTQELVAESIGVSRQAVSKWENGLSDPSTSNLIALANLFQISSEALLREVQS